MCLEIARRNRLSHLEEDGETSGNCIFEWEKSGASDLAHGICIHEPDDGRHSMAARRAFVFNCTGTVTACWYL